MNHGGVEFVVTGEFGDLGHLAVAVDIAADVHVPEHDILREVHGVVGARIGLQPAVVLTHPPVANPPGLVAVGDRVEGDRPAAKGERALPAATLFVAVISHPREGAVRVRAVVVGRVSALEAELDARLFAGEHTGRALSVLEREPPHVPVGETLLGRDLNTVDSDEEGLGAHRGPVEA
ncbi:unannotated protein [freshwater metagenome]|uniref:Unannotated protein n=1 Tax=freshwater metagenome TaxID=449393 RepID=A0A6J7C3F6_9ZZZZ